MNDDDIQQIFFVECEEALQAAEDGLAACKAGTQDDETINAIFRAVHSIKGGAGAFGHGAMAAYTHCFENLLGDIREDKVALTPELVDLLLLALDLLSDHVGAARAGGGAPDDSALMEQLEAARDPAQAEASEPEAAEPTATAASDNAAPYGDALDDPLDDISALLDEIAGPDDSSGPQDTAAGSAPPPADTDDQTWIVHIRPRAGGMTNGSEPLLWLRDLAQLGGECVACETGDLPAIDRIDPEESYLGWTYRMPASVDQASVEEIFDFVGEDCALAFGDAPMPKLVLKASTPGAAPTDAGDDAAELQTRAPTAKPAAAADPTPAPVSNSVSGSKATPATKPAAGSANASPPQAPDAAPAEKKVTAAPQTSQSVRIDLSKLDRLIDGVGELVIAQAMLTQRLENENIAHIEELSMLDGLVRDIQEHAMAFRAQPISSVFGRVPRLLRELANDTGKHVKLEVFGETTELDKTVIERLSEPMTHLIRNAVDHGIEPPEERRAAGKDPEGTLTLSAEQKAGRIVIQISDNGRGIDREKVLAKAIRNGLISEDAELSDEEVNQLVFAPGFSTAAQVSNISGRGVGMDVVRQNVKDLGGRITIDSTPGQGTSFTLALPLTLAISDGMIVQVGDQSLVIPLTHIIESLRPASGDIKGLGTQRQMLNVRGRFVPVVSLGQMTGAHGCVDDPCKGVLVLVETESFGRAALLVDAISDQRQFVIKSLDAHYRTVDSVAGATILGNGRVALIVDVDYLVQCSSGAIDAPAMPKLAAA